MERIGVDDPIAAGVQENILRGRAGSTITDVMETRTFNKERNRREAIILSRVLDCMRGKQYHAAVELIARRLVGVQLADKSGSWDMASVLEGASQAGADLPDTALRRVLKTAANMSSLAKMGSSSSGSGDRPANNKGRGGGNSSSSSAAPRGRSTPHDQSRAASRERPAHAGNGDDKNFKSSQPKGGQRH